MINFRIEFIYPWLLLLLIPAVAFTLIPHLRRPKKYRRTRNRIVSIVLHLTCMTLAILGLAGLHFTYDEPNENNELLILIDSSYSGRKEASEKNAFVRSIINENDASVKVGIVTFGYDQVYAAELSYDKNEVYEQYLNAVEVDETATDIASALNYAKDLFEHPETSKIVLISDGVETDAKALNVIKSIAAEGTKVDVAYFPADQSGNEVQIVDMLLPETKIELNEPVEVGVTLQSSYVGQVEVTLYDNEKEAVKKTVELAKNEKSFSVMHTFTEKGMHTLRFEIESPTDNLEQNNLYYSYVYLEDFNRILIIERTAGESEDFQEMLNSKPVEEGEIGYEITAIAVSALESIPSTVNELRYYDQVVLVNIANADMPVWENGTRFDELLYDYVYEYGGGMLTIGGNKDEEMTDEDNPVANTYVRDDMYDTLYQDMLPVEAIEYTPPAGVIVIIDWSGSMSSIDAMTGKTFLDLAKDGARAAVNALTERDYCGIVSLEDSYREEMKPLPLPKKAEILAAIDNLGEDQSGGGTVYQGAIEQAGAALEKLDVERKHIILVSDAAPSDTYEDYSKAIKANYEKGITMSVVVVGTAITNDMEKAAKAGGGNCYSGSTSIPTLMRTDLEMPLIKGVTYEPFHPQIGTVTSVLQGITQEQLDEVTLEGFYGTKLKSDAVQPLKGAYVPIYAQWNFGEGKVGSFMCKLSSEGWGKEFVASEVGRLFINNVVGDLFPTKNIHAQDIEVSLTEDNYTNSLSIYPTQYSEGDHFEVTITSPATTEGGEETVQTLESEESSFGRKFSFAIKQAGIHTIVIRQLDKDGNPVVGVSDCVIYKTFSYSEEYNIFYDPLVYEQMLMELASEGKGKIVTDAEEVFRDFEKYIHRIIDPTLPFIITVLVLFLLDVAVRKFKFKWPHEIIRDYKAKKLLEKK